MSSHDANDAASHARREELAREMLPPLPRMAHVSGVPGGTVVGGGAPRPWRGYAPEEWALLERFPLLVGACVSVVDDSGRRGTQKEENAIPRAYEDGAARYPTNPIIQSVLRMTQQAQPLIERARLLIERSDPNMLRDELAREAPRVVAALRRAPSAQVGEEYKRFVLEVGEAVASAAKEGGFPRFASTEVSEWERATIQWVAEALRLGNLPSDWANAGIDSWQRGV
jgi:hypothetical protein